MSRGALSAPLPRGDAMGGEDVTAIRHEMDALNGIWSEIASRLYQQATAGASAESGGAGAASAESRGPDQGAEEADFEVVDDDKK